MAGKIGEDFFRDQLDRGRRELGGLFYDGSNIAQPMYPLRGSYGPSKEAEPSHGINEKVQSFEDLHPVGPSQDEPGKDERDLGIERE